MLFSWVHPFRDVSPFRIRPGLRRATFPAGKGFWGVPAPLSVFFWALALAVVFAVLPLIRQPFGLPPSPEGEGFGAAQPRMCYGKPTWSAGAASALRTANIPIRPPPCNESGDPQKVVVYHQGGRLKLPAATGRPPRKMTVCNGRWL